MLLPTKLGSKPWAENLPVNGAVTILFFAKQLGIQDIWENQLFCSSPDSREFIFLVCMGTSSLGE